jgi:hypothetical protein
MAIILKRKAVTTEKVKIIQEVEKNPTVMK